MSTATAGGNVGIRPEVDRGSKLLGNITLIIVILTLVYQLYYTRSPWEPDLHRITHLGLAMVIVLLVDWQRNRRLWPLHLLMIALGLASTVYFSIAYEQLAQFTAILPTPAVVFGVISMVVTFILCWRTTGPTFPIIAALGIVYMFVAPYMPPPLTAPPVGARRILGWLGGDVTQAWGIYGSILSISANYLFLFIAFGALLDVFGGLRFIQTLGNLASSRMRSGPAALAVFSSAALGTMTGSTVANITITGSFTMPMTKRAGYTPEQAAGIETAASSGGQILPPIMGATAFVMAAYTGIRYVDVALAAVTPALIYFAILLLYAELNARKLGIQRAAQVERIDVRQLMYDGTIFLIPLGLLLVLLIQGYSLLFVVFWSITTLVVIGLLNALLRPEARLKWEEVKVKLSNGVYQGCEVAVICALIGVVVTAVEMTGLGINLGGALLSLVGNNLFLLLVVTFIASLILGTGVPTTAAYTLVAMVMSPALIMMGVPVLIAHFFPFFYAVFSHLTPPVGIGLFVAAKMAGASYWGSAREALKGAVGAFILPFCFVYAPVLLLHFEGFTTTQIVMQIVAVVLVLVASQFLVNDYCFGRLRVVDRLLFGVSALMLFIYIVWTKAAFAPVIVFAGVAIWVLGFVLNIAAVRRSKALPGTAVS